LATTDKEQSQPEGTPKGGVSKDGAPHLTWASKPTVIERVSLPFQVVETINESRATREAYSGSLFGSPGASASAAWYNKLVWGDNKLVMGSLLKDFAGQVKLIYIDPPFATGDDFSVQVQVGDASLVKEPSILEEHAYRDTWGAGYNSYLSMMYERIVLIRDLWTSPGSVDTGTVRRLAVLS
jgi:adenine-specific DNA-methyltransferase